MPVRIEIEGLDQLRKRFRQHPQQFSRALRKTVDASLVVLHENVPPYPIASQTSTYIRTGTLGRSLGANMQGGMLGKPDIYTVKPQGPMMTGEFGTRLKYAPYVIGEREQAWMHYRWWTIRTIAERSAAKIQRLFQIMAEELAKWLSNP